MSLANFGASTPLLLPLGGHPATHPFEADWILAVPLVPTLGLVNAATLFSQTDAEAKAAPAGRMALAESMLEMSQGRCFLPKGPPERL